MIDKQLWVILLNNYDNIEMWLEKWLEINQKALQSFDYKAFIFPKCDPAGN